MAKETNKGMRFFTAPDGVVWGVEVKVPSHSSAMVVFRHPSGESARLDRYAWYNARFDEASDPRARLRSEKVLDALSDAELSRLFRRSMPVHTERPRFAA
jgi:hypothetical protein